MAMASITLEERVERIEAELLQVKEQLGGLPRSGAPWWKKVVGVYKDDPEFTEAMRLGREYRESLRPMETQGAD
jgi:hypothetical protein